MSENTYAAISQLALFIFNTQALNFLHAILCRALSHIFRIPRLSNC